MKALKVIGSAISAYLLYKKLSDSSESESPENDPLQAQYEAVERAIAEDADFALEYFNDQIDLNNLDYSKVLSAKLVVSIGIHRFLANIKYDSAFVLYLTNHNTVPVYITGIRAVWSFANFHPVWVPYDLSDIKIAPGETVKVRLAGTHKNTTLFRSKGTMVYNEDGSFTSWSRNENVEAYSYLTGIGENKYVIGKSEIWFLINTGTGNLVARYLDNVETFVYYTGNTYYEGSPAMGSQAAAQFDNVIQNSYH